MNLELKTTIDQMTEELRLTTETLTGELESTKARFTAQVLLLPQNLIHVLIMSLVERDKCEVESVRGARRAAPPQD